MFTKLLKHEFRSQAGLFSILSGAALIAGLLGSLMMRIFVNTTMNASVYYDDFKMLLGTAFPMLILMALIFAIGVYSIAVMLLLFYRFYKHHFSDEGYLTFTLPATTHQILLASIVNIAIWILISLVVTAVSILLIILPITTASEFLAGESLTEIFSMMFQEFGASYLILQVLSGLFTAFGNMILAMLSITLGSIVVKKYKLLAGFGIYYGINMIISVFSGIFGTFAVFGDFAISAETGYYGGILTLLLPAVLYLGIGIGGYFLMHYLVDEKLNLP